MKKIAVFGGTFNPVHSEHVNMVESAIEELNLDKVIIVPTNIPPHKTTELAPNEHRLNMLKLCFSSNKKVEISDFEYTNGGKSYSYITVEHFSEIYSGDQLFFMVGGDMLKDFKTWVNPSRILDKATLVAFFREKEEVDFEREREYFNKTFQKDFIKLNYKGKNVSSTKIRIYVGLGLSVSELISKEVVEYINANKLYQGKKEFEFIKNTLPEKRLTHTAEVTICALKKAKELNLSQEKVVKSAVLHDCAKYIDYTTVRGFRLEEEMPKPVIHAFLGAFIAKNYLKIEDEEIINAIKYHTSGRAKMSKLEKLIFVADMIEPSRNYQGVDTLRKLYEIDFEKCFRECLKEEMEHLANGKNPIYHETLNAYNYYIENKGE